MMSRCTFNLCDCSVKTYSTEQLQAALAAATAELATKVLQHTQRSSGLMCCWQDLEITQLSQQLQIATESATGSEAAAAESEAVSSDLRAGLWAQAQVRRPGGPTDCCWTDCFVGLTVVGLTVLLKCGVFG